MHEILRKIREGLTIVPSSIHPNFNDYSIKNELLQIISHDPEMLCSLVEKQENILLTIYQELRELEQLEILDEDSANFLADRLIVFLKTIKVGNYSGEGAFWLPQNYLGDGDDEPEREDYEDYIRRIICAHIIPISQDKMTMMTTLVDSLNNSDDEIISHVARSHFAPLFRFRGDIPSSALITLMAEEFRCIKNEEMVDGNSLFVFNEFHMNMTNATIPITEAHERLQYSRFRFITIFYYRISEVSQLVLLILLIVS